MTEWHKSVEKAHQRDSAKGTSKAAGRHGETAPAQRSARCAQAALGAGTGRSSTAEAGEEPGCIMKAEQEGPAAWLASCQALKCSVDILTNGIYQRYCSPTTHLRTLLFLNITPSPAPWAPAHIWTPLRAEDSCVLPALSRRLSHLLGCCTSSRGSDS